LLFDNINDVPGWEAGTTDEGFLLQDGVEETIEFLTGQKLRAGFPFFIRYSGAGGGDFSVKGSTVDIGFGATFVPYQISTIMAGYEREVFPLEFRELTSSALTLTNNDYDLTPVTKLDDDVDILAGDYVVTLSFSAGMTSTNRRVVVGLFIGDALVFDEYQQESKDIFDNPYPSKTFKHTFTQGVHNFKVKFGKRGGGGAAFASISDVAVVMRRVSR
jgi:hypothetical protein